jgi:hypothetical protein
MMNPGASVELQHPADGDHRNKNVIVVPDRHFPRLLPGVDRRPLTRGRVEFIEIAECVIKDRVRDPDIVLAINCY